MVILKAPSESGSCSYDGTEYKIVDGFVEVPPEAVVALKDHGFGLTPEKDEPDFKALAGKGKK